MANMYPKEVSPLITNKNTLSCNCLLSPLTEEDITKGAKPYDIHSPFSRVVFTIIDYSDSQSKKTVSANIPAKRRLKSLCKGVEVAADICRKEKWTAHSSSKETEAENENLAYTVVMTAGKLKGKTPAQLMLENPDENRNLLKSQYIWLKNKLGKYPSNQKQMDAIAEAINLYDAGALSAEQVTATAVSSSEFIVYEDQIKIPHADKKDENGCTDIYSFKIVCNPEKKYPFAITIMNGKAPVNKGENGTITANMQAAKDVTKLTFNASLEDFESLAEDLSQRVKSFESMWFPTMHKKAEQLDREARNATKK